MSQAEYISVDEALEKNSQEQNLRKCSGQLLVCSHIFYRIFHRVVCSCTHVRK